MAASKSICYIKGVAPSPVDVSFTNQTGTKRIAASVDIMEESSTVQVQLTSAFPVGSIFGPQEVITCRCSTRTKNFVRCLGFKCTIIDYITLTFIYFSLNCFCLLDSFAD